MDVNEAIKRALDGEVILFLGAGFSIGGTNKRGRALPSATELSSHLCEKMGRER